MLQMRAQLEFTRVPLLTTLEPGFSYLSIGRVRLRLGNTFGETVVPDDAVRYKQPVLLDALTQLGPELQTASSLSRRTGRRRRADRKSVV